MGRDGVHVTDIFAVKSSENVIAVFFRVRDEADRSEVGGELFDWHNSVWWISADNSLC
jgi:hypothetical protein